MALHVPVERSMKDVMREAVSLHISKSIAVTSDKRNIAPRNKYLYATIKMNKLF